MYKIVMMLLGGIIIAVALILPGISTSFLLMVLGLYEPILNALKRLDVEIIGLLLIGVIIGILLTTKILSWALVKHPNPTYSVILGFIAGSLKAIVPSITASFQVFKGVSWFVVGFILMWFLEKMLKKSSLQRD